MSSLESALDQLDSKVQRAEAEADALVKAVRRLRAAVAVGNIQQLERQLVELPALAEAAAGATSELDGAWSFDARDYLEQGYTAELTAAAAAEGVNIFEKDGRLFAFPFLVRVVPSDIAVRIGRAAERGIRPKAIATKLKTLLGRPAKVNEQRFLDLLYKAYQRLAGADWRRLEHGEGPAIPLSDIHEVITLLPGADYSAEEFGRDMLFLDRRPELTARDGTPFSLAGSTMGKSARKIVIYDEGGNTREFIAIRFVKGA